MITVRGRELVIPLDEREIGTTYDNNAEVRRFRLGRAPGGIDLAHLTYSLDLEYKGTIKDTCVLEKEVDGDGVVLVWTVPASCVAEPGTVWIALRGMDDYGTIKWASNKGAVYVHDTVDTPGTYTGDLSELEQLEAGIAGKMKALDSSEKTRQEQEQHRQEESARAVQAADSAAKRATDAAVGVEAAIERANTAASGVEAATDRANTAAERTEKAVSDAQAAAESANKAAGSVDRAKEEASAAASAASEAAGRANDAAEAAQTVTGRAAEAAEGAESARDRANSAAEGVEEATERANRAAAGTEDAIREAGAAADRADAAAGSVEEAKAKAETAADAANTAADTASSAADAAAGAAESASGAGEAASAAAGLASAAAGEASTAAQLADQARQELLGMLIADYSQKTPGTHALDAYVGYLIDQRLNELVQKYTQLNSDISELNSALNLTDFRSVKIYQNRCKDLIGGYVQIGRIVIVNVQFVSTEKHGGSSNFLFGFPIPSSFERIPAITCYRRGPDADGSQFSYNGPTYIKNNGYMEITGAVEADDIIFVSGIYLAK